MDMDRDLQLKIKEDVAFFKSLPPEDRKILFEELPIIERAGRFFYLSKDRDMELDLENMVVIDKKLLRRITDIAVLEEISKEYLQKREEMTDEAIERIGKFIEEIKEG